MATTIMCLPEEVCNNCKAKFLSNVVFEKDSLYFSQRNFLSLKNKQIFQILSA